MTPRSDGPAAFPDVFAAEIEEIRARRQRLGIPDTALTDTPRPANGLVGLSFSGGGIRSATFGLGVVQALDASGLLRAVDYLSTVSGGGFIGGCVSSMLAGNPPLAQPWAPRTGMAESAAVRHLRDRSRYLAPGGLLDTLRIAAVAVRGVLVNAMTLAPYVMLAVLLTSLVFDYNLLRSDDPDGANLANSILSAVMSVFIGLILTFPIVSTVIVRWLNLAWRSRYEMLLSWALLAVLVACAFVPLFDLATAASYLTAADLADRWRDLEAAVLHAPVWQIAIAVGALGAVAAWVARRAQASGAWLNGVLRAVGLLAPAALLAVYLLACIGQVETPQLDTLAWEADPDVESIRALDAGIVSERLARARPRLDPLPTTDSTVDGERLIASSGAILAVGSGEAGATTELTFVFAVDLPLNDELEELDEGRVPARIGRELVQDGDVWHHLREAKVTSIPRTQAWRLAAADGFVFVVRRAARSLQVFWERPLEKPALEKPAPMVRLAARAHIMTIEPGRAWRLTTAGRALVVRFEHERLRLFWDLTPILDYGLRTDVLVSAFGSSKGKLPDSIRIRPSLYENEKARVAGWSLCSAKTRPPCDLYDPQTFFVAMESDGRFWSTKRAPLGLVSRFGFGVLLLYLLSLNAAFIDVNRNSAHGFYRDRVSEAFVIKPDPATPWAVVHNDGQKLSTLNGPGSIAPYHLVNCTLNLAGSDGAGVGRPCDFFLFGKRFSGSERTGYARTLDLERIDPHLDLATALAISGAAAAPNAGTATMRPVRLLLTLLNVRLDYWIANPAMVAGPWWARLRLRRSIGSRYLWREAIGLMDARGPFINVSDGSHIENLGVYELLRRRCRLIVAIDGEADPALTCDSLLAVVMYARMDLGVDIDVDLDDVRQDEHGFSRSHIAIGRVRYGDGDGWLVYLKSSLTGDEDELIRAYRRRCLAFPHQSTANQFFDEREFEMYRALGEHVAQALADAIAGATPSPAFDGAAAAALIELRSLAAAGAVSAVNRAGAVL